jgi:hypothetical protein
VTGKSDLESNIIAAGSTWEGEKLLPPGATPMDARPHNHAEPRHGHELDEEIRRAVRQARAAAPPADALARALEKARRPRLPTPAWHRWLLRGEAGRN